MWKVRVNIATVPKLYHFFSLFAKIFNSALHTSKDGNERQVICEIYPFKLDCSSGFTLDQKVSPPAKAFQAKLCLDLVLNHCCLSHIPAQIGSPHLFTMVPGTKWPVLLIVLKWLVERCIRHTFFNPKDRHNSVAEADMFNYPLL